MPLGKGPSAVAAWGALVVAFSAVRPARADHEACFEAAEQAQLLRYRGDLVATKAQLLVCAAEGCPGRVRSDCTQWLSEVTQVLPSIAIHAQDARGRDVIGARVLIDGARAAERLGGTALAVNPGAHRIRLETSSGVVAEEQVLVVEGQKGRVLELTLPASLEVDGSRSAAAPLAPAPSAPTSAHVSWASAALGAAGLAWLGAAVVFEVVGQNEYRALVRGCGTTHTCSSSDVDSSKEKLYMAAPLALGAGVASLGAATVLLLLQRSPPRTAWASHVEVVGEPAGAAITWKGAF